MALEKEIINIENIIINKIKNRAIIISNKNKVMKMCWLNRTISLRGEP